MHGSLLTMLAASEARYRARFQKVLDHIDVELDGDLSVDRLSAVAAFSKFHFQRQFAAMFGLGVHQYVTLRRLKRASYQLAFRRDLSILDIGLSSGYEGPESFSRAFRRTFRQSPSQFRRSPDWPTWHEIYRQGLDMREQAPRAPSHAAVEIVTCRDTQVAALEHRGDPERIFESIRTFIAWRRRNQLIPPASATFNVFHDDAGVRVDLCAGTNRPVAPNDEGVVSKTIPAGRCAVVRHRGPDDGLHTTIHALYANWLPASGEEPRGFPIYLRRVRWFPDVPEGEACSDVYLPLQ